MIKKILVVLFCAGALAACDPSDLTSSGGGDSAQTLASAPVAATEATSAEVSETSKPVETPPVEAPPVETPPVETPPADTPSEPSPPVASKECGAGRYEFRTDSDNKFHFDALFEPGGVIRYNFTVQPNTGNWRVSGNRMIFNGPFAAGASNHVSTWTITSRASDCSVMEFRGKSYGQSDVTATRR